MMMARALTESLPDPAALTSGLTLGYVGMSATDLYRLAIDVLTRPKGDGSKPTINTATTRFLLHVDGERTPDGAKFTRTAVKNALSGLET